MENTAFKSFIEVKLNGDETRLFSIRSPVASIKVGSEIFPGRILQKSQPLIESNHGPGLPGLRKMALDPFPDQTCSQPGPLDVQELLRQLSYAIKNQLKALNVIK